MIANAETPIVPQKSKKFYKPNPSVKSVKAIKAIRKAQKDQVKHKRLSDKHRNSSSDTNSPEYVSSSSEDNSLEFITKKQSIY